jgi:hypothetical protein
MNEKGKNFKWWILGAVFLLCLLVYALIPATPWGMALKRKDAVTALIALAGVIGVVANFFQTRKRITQQEEQFEKQQRDARFASGVELLGNPHESTRIGGANTLYFLSRDFSEFQEPVCEILCAHLRTIASKEIFVTNQQRYPENEVSTLFNLLFSKRSGKIFVEQKKNLCGILLQGEYKNMQLSHDYFNKSKLTDVRFVHPCTFENVEFHKATLEDITFANCKLTGVEFNEATLTEVDFEGATLIYVDFSDTPLADFTPKQIKTFGFSLEKTAPNP